MSACSSDFIFQPLRLQASHTKGQRLCVELSMPDCDDTLLSSYQYILPPELIAQEPPVERGQSRLLLVPRTGELTLQHQQFAQLPSLLPKGALLVANNSRVLPARLFGTRHTGGKVEFLLLSPLPLVLAQAQKTSQGYESTPVECLLRCGGHLQIGEELHFGALGVRIVRIKDFGKCDVDLFWQGDLAAIFTDNGAMPLPPYIRRKPESADLVRYQTIYAKDEKLGSVAAPTAGLHFTPAIRAELAAHGIEWAELTLYVGYGTFSPVRCENILEHTMHEELIDIPAATAEAVQRAKAQGRPVIAVGTTSVRALEGAYAALGTVSAYHGFTNIFLYPGKDLHVIDGLITNFHLPGSSLLMLVSAFMGRKRTLAVYEQAVAARYRFFSYGDAMFIMP